MSLEPIVGRYLQLRYNELDYRIFFEEAGQGVPLTSFPEGEYRLLIRISDRVSKRSLERDVAFTVQS